MAGQPIRRARRLAAQQAEAREAILNAKKKTLAAIKETRPENYDWEDPVPATTADPISRLKAMHADVINTPNAEVLPSGLVKMEDGTLLNQKQFDDLVNLAFDRARDIMEIKIDPKDPDSMKLATRQTTIITSVMTTLARIDEARLRRIRESGIQRVLEAIRKAKEQIV